MTIRVSYASVDGVRKARNFETLEEAAAFAQGAIGRHPEIGRSYAISGDGVSRIMVAGATLKALFPATEGLVAAGLTVIEID